MPSTATVRWDEVLNKTQEQLSAMPECKHVERGTTFELVEWDIPTQVMVTRQVFSIEKVRFSYIDNPTLCKLEVKDDLQITSTLDGRVVEIKALKLMEDKIFLKYFCGWVWMNNDTRRARTKMHLSLLVKIVHDLLPASEEQRITLQHRPGSHFLDEPIDAGGC